MQLLWSFIAQYILKYNIDIMFGCASFPGIDPVAHQRPFDYLHRNYLAPKSIRPQALKSRKINMKKKNYKIFLLRNFCHLFHL